MILTRIGSNEKYILSLDKNNYEIGRNPDCDITFRSKYVSRKHCEITRIPPHGSLLIKNKTNTNSTYVDEIQLKTFEAIAELRIGSQIGLGIPLSYMDDSEKNSEFVFLKVCSSEEEQHRKVTQRKENCIESKLSEKTPPAKYSASSGTIATHSSIVKLNAAQSLGDNSSFFIKKEPQQDVRINAESSIPNHIPTASPLTSHDNSSNKNDTTVVDGLKQNGFINASNCKFKVEHSDLKQEPIEDVSNPSTPEIINSPVCSEINCKVNASILATFEPYNDMQQQGNRSPKDDPPQYDLIVLCDSDSSDCVQDLFPFNKKQPSSPELLPLDDISPLIPELNRPIKRKCTASNDLESSLKVLKKAVELDIPPITVKQDPEAHSSHANADVLKNDLLPTSNIKVETNPIISIVGSFQASIANKDTSSLASSYNKFTMGCSVVVRKLTSEQIAQYGASNAHNLGKSLIDAANKEINALSASSNALSESKDFHTLSDYETSLNIDRPIKSEPNIDVGTIEKNVLGTPSIAKQIKQEFIGESTHKDPVESCDSDDDDFFMTMYSQRDEVVVISSDEDELTDSGVSPNTSYRPIPSSPDLDLGTLFEDDSCDSTDFIFDKEKIKEDTSDQSSQANKDKKVEENNSTIKRSLLKLSRSHSKHDLQEVTSDIKSPRDFSLDDDHLLIPRNQLAHFSEGDQDKSIQGRIEKECCHEKDKLNDWWPVLSQEFDYDSAPSFEPVSINDKNAKNLGIVIKRLEDKPRSSGTKFIEPVPPPSRKSKRKEHRKVKEPSVATQPGTSRELSLNKGSSSMELTKKPHVSSHPVPLKKKKKYPSLRSTLLKSHKLESYKASIENLHKEKHHIMPAASNIAEARVKGKEFFSPSENISIRPKTSEKKGIAKISRVTRSEKLTEVDLFSTVGHKLPKPKSSFKIPKKSSKENQTDSNQIKTRFNESSTLNANMSRQSALEPHPPLLHIELQKTLLTKSANAKPQRNLKVHFPNNEEELVSIKFISPRKVRDCRGPRLVQMKETFFPNSSHKVEKPSISHNLKPHDEHEFIYHICSWNYDWLITYHKAKNSQSRSKIPSIPPVGTSTALPTLILYNSYKDYMEIFSNLMYYEMWENIYKDWNKYYSSDNKLICLPDKRDTVFFSSAGQTLKFTKIMVISLITKEMNQQNRHPYAGYLVAVKEKKEKAPCAFGYVIKIEKRRGNNCIPNELRASCPKDADTLLLLHILFSKSKLEDYISHQNLVDLRNISYIKPALRSFEALCRLPGLSICPYLLKPDDLSVFQNSSKADPFIVDEIPLDDVQKRAVCEISNICCHKSEDPKISLIHGPPGSGKTRVISALIVQITRMQKLHNSSNRRILVCAPSNAAVDELTLRILKLSELRIFINVVRVGVRRSINPAVKKCSFDEKLRRLIERKLAPQNKSLEEELKHRKHCLAEATDKYLRASQENSSPEERKRLESRMVELARSEKDLRESCKKNLTAKERECIESECRKRVLMEAEVITTTLTSCLSGVLYDTFSNARQNPFVCCIVDEAGQCKETETWLPFMLGIQKLVLVGDHLQLPATVISQFAQGQKLHQSLFERLYHHLVFQKNQCDLVHTLTTQYRMHAEIAAWPSEHFYHNSLLTDPTTSSSLVYEIKPYLVWDLQDTHEEMLNQGEIFNMGEVTFIVRLIEALENHFANKTIGILTPYQQQKIYLAEKLSPFMCSLDITVSTIDNFQGQERDVIICSFVRANAGSKIGFVSDRQRLNVALTRAKHSCFVIGNLANMILSEDWRALISDARQRKLVYPVFSNKLLERHDLLALLQRCSKPL